MIPGNRYAGMIDKYFSKINEKDNCGLIICSELCPDSGRSRPGNDSVTFEKCSFACLECTRRKTFSETN